MKDVFDFIQSNNQGQYRSDERETRVNLARLVEQEDHMQSTGRGEKSIKTNKQETSKFLSDISRKKKAA